MLTSHRHDMLPFVSSAPTSYALSTVVSFCFFGFDSLCTFLLLTENNVQNILKLQPGFLILKICSMFGTGFLKI